MKKSIAVMLTGLVAAHLSAPRSALAAESGEVEELRREVRQLQAQLQALRTAITEATELDRQRASILLRALKGPSAAAVDSTPPPSSAKAEAVAPSRAAPPTPPPPTRETRAGRRSPPPATAAPAAAAPAPAEPTTGSIRGKIAMPGGEPVAYVYVENILAPAVKKNVTIEQVGKRFVPNWAVVQRGTTITFPNRDNIYHNVFSLSSGNSFDLGLYNAGSEAKTHTFTEPGAVDIYCNIHPQMSASTLVVPNRHYAKVKADGSFEIPGVPTGRRKVVGWSPGSRLTTEWVEVSPGQAAEVEMKLESKAPGHKNKSGQSYGSYD